MLVGGLQARAPDVRPHRRQRAVADAAAGRRRAGHAGDLRARDRRRPARARPTRSSDFPSDLEQLSFGVAIVLLITYVAGLSSRCKTHRDLFNPTHAEEDHVGDAVDGPARA